MPLPNYADATLWVATPPSFLPLPLPLLPPPPPPPPQLPFSLTFDRGGNSNLYHALQVTSEMFTEENEFIIQDEGLSQEEKRKYIFLCAEGN